MTLNYISVKKNFNKNYRCLINYSWQYYLKEKIFNLQLVIIFLTNTPPVFHVETTWKRSFPRRFNVEFTWRVCRVDSARKNQKGITWLHHYYVRSCYQSLQILLDSLIAWISWLLVLKCNPAVVLMKFNLQKRFYSIDSLSL